MKVKEAIKKGFVIGKQNMTLIILLFAVNLMMSGIGFLFGLGPTATPRPLEEINFLPVITFVLLAMGIGIFVQGGVLGVVRDFVKWKEKVKLSKFFLSYAKKFFLRLLGLGLLMMGIVLAILLVTGGVSALIVLIVGAEIGGIVSAIFLGLGVLAIVLVMFLLFPAYFILVVEETGVIAAVKKSISFVKKFFGKVLGLLILWLLIYVGISVVIGLIALLLGNVGNIAIQRIVGTILNGAIGSFMMVCITGSWISFYLALNGTNKETTTIIPE
jgi:hypothetical protein